MSLFTGSGVAIVTPFTNNLEVDFAKLKELIDFQIENGTDSIIICGTTGEASTLTHEEHLECIKVCVEHVNKRVPVIAGTGSNCTSTAVYLSQEAQKLGADGLLIVTPYYNKATQKGLKAHFTAIANAVELPIILYNVPSRTGCNILPETVVDLVNEVENIIAIKEASGNISQVVKLMQLANNKVDVYSGNDDQVIPILSLGGKGVISVVANVAPRLMHDMVDQYLSGNTAEGLKIQLDALELSDALFCEVNPIPIKKAVELMGLCGGELRMPLTTMEPQNAQKLEKAMKELGLI